MLCLSVLWAGAATALSCLAPGPGQPPPQPKQHIPRHANLPPVVGEGSGYISMSSAEGSARVFWTVPESGNVKIKIEIPPQGGKKADRGGKN